MGFWTVIYRDTYISESILLIDIDLFRKQYFTFKFIKVRLRYNYVLQISDSFKYIFDCYAVS